jgi:hypothetical protein
MQTHTVLFHRFSSLFSSWPHHLLFRLCCFSYKVADPVVGPPISPFYLRCINHFSAARGFELFVARFAKTEAATRPSLPVLRLMLKIVLKVCVPLLIRLLRLSLSHLLFVGLFR